jgi:transcriptional regulator with XRE-family HTH domain
MKKNVGRHILHLAEQAGITQTELATKTGLSTAAVAMWGKGHNPHADNLPRVAEALGITVEELLNCQTDTDSAITLHKTCVDCIMISALLRDNARLTKDLNRERETIHRLSSALAVTETRLDNLKRMGV